MTMHLQEILSHLNERGIIKKKVQVWETPIVILFSYVLESTIAEDPLWCLFLSLGGGLLGLLTLVLGGGLFLATIGGRWCLVLGLGYLIAF